VKNQIMASLHSPIILVTGAFGQIGTELVPFLQNKHGKSNVVALAHHNLPKDFQGIAEQGDILEKKKLKDIVEKYGITQIYHMASILSAVGEKNPSRTWDVNIEGLRNVLELAAEKKLKIFWPSSIAAFGPTTPRDNTPQRTILEPTTMYGVSKVSGELLCQYYHHKFAVDIRSLRYPGIISYKAEPGGGTTDYAVAIFYGAIQEMRYTCFVKADTVLPMMYMDDAIRGTIEVMEAPKEKLTVWTSYNHSGISFSAEDLANEIKKHIPSFIVSYEPDHRQLIADSWPRSIDDSIARKDWNWSHEYNLEKMTKVMLKNLEVKLKK